MKTLARYLEVIVDPTFDDFHANRGSFRHAYFTCGAIFHAVDRAAEELGQSPAAVRQAWRKEYQDFNWIDIIAHHFKHVESSAEKNLARRPGLSVSRAIGFDDLGEEFDLRNLYYVIRDTVRFVHRKAGTTHPKLP